MTDAEAAGTALAAFNLTAALLIALESKGVLAPGETKQLIDETAHALEQQDALVVAEKRPACREARRVLEALLQALPPSL